MSEQGFLEDSVSRNAALGACNCLSLWAKALALLAGAGSETLSLKSFVRRSFNAWLSQRGESSTLLPFENVVTTNMTVAFRGSACIRLGPPGLFFSYARRRPWIQEGSSSAGHL